MGDVDQFFSLEKIEIAEAKNLQFNDHIIHFNSRYFRQRIYSKQLLQTETEVRDVELKQ